jgi:RNA polymerase sigma factor (sigma-70 family)
MDGAIVLEPESESLGEGFESLYSREFAMVYRVTCLVARNRQAAEEATQEAFARALERWSTLAGQPWAGAWITRVAVNEAKRTRASRWRIVSLEHDVGIPEADWSSIIALRVAMRGLSRRQQEAVILHYIRDEPLAVVARTTGCRIGTVKSHLSRARESLHEFLEVEDGR